ncbi:uncharacterized protein LOC110673102 [Hevea brasiliensis]|uniref:uncharacterized protein LOC110673102 n=1 Tax=Hevea brasiliensis TaxID=3981 RepID=UPI0025D220A9|nr:uncharacterized protein LOC110673102 [Hevea brasiliensis]
MAPKIDNPLTSILNENRLTGPNFMDWLRNLRIVLNYERIGYILETTLPCTLPESASEEERETLKKWKEDDVQSRTAKYEISKQLFRMRMVEGQDIDQHINKMIRLTEQLESMDFTIHADLQLDLILQSLLNSFSHFVINFNMNKLECTLAGLLNMAVIAQKGMLAYKEKEAMNVASSSSGTKGKGNKKKKKASTPGLLKKISKKLVKVAAKAPIV